MQQKRITAIFIALLLICALVLAGTVLMQRASEPSSSEATPSETAQSAPVISETESQTPSEAVSDTPQTSQPPAEESSDEPTSSPVGDTVVSFLACPDNVIHPSVYYDAIIRACAKSGKTPSFSKLESAEYDFAPIYENVAAAIAAADVAYLNCETLIGGNDSEISGYPMFNTPEAEGELLCSLGFDVFNLAHNHMLDSGNDKYLINCDRFFTDRGKTTIGYYKNSDDTSNIKIVTKNGIRIAFLAYTFSTNGITLRNSETYIPYFDETLIRKQVALAKAQSDVIIASCHWGTEDTYVPNSYQKQYASLLVSLNVDVVLGMHPHVIQPMSWESRPDGGKTLVVYSLGNFISGMQDGFDMLGGMLSFDLVKSAATGKVTVENVIFDPTVTHYIYGTKVKPDDTGHREYKIYYVSDYTEELASKHGVRIWDTYHTPTLVGGTLTKANLIATVKKYIPAEFLREYYQ